MKTPEQMATEFLLKSDCAHSAFLAGYQAAKDQLADADKVMTPQPNNWHWWRSIYTEYPDESGEFLVLVQYPDGAKECDISKYEKDMYFALRYVTHWMPLPKPPEDK